MPKRPPWNTVCEYFFFPRATLFPNIRKHEHLMMFEFMSWESSGWITNVKAFSYSGKHEIWGEWYANDSSLLSAKGTVQSGDTETTDWRRKEQRVIFSKVSDRRPRRWETRDVHLLHMKYSVNRHSLSVLLLCEHKRLWASPFLPFFFLFFLRCGNRFKNWLSDLSKIVQLICRLPALNAACHVAFIQQKFSFLLDLLWKWNNGAEHSDRYL